MLRIKIDKDQYELRIDPEIAEIKVYRGDEFLWSSEFDEYSEPDTILEMFWEQVMFRRFEELLIDAKAERESYLSVKQEEERRWG